MKGHVARLVSDKGFGFITGADGEDHFFHRSEVREGRFEDLKDGGPNRGGTAVEFDSVNAPKGKRAENVRVVQ